MIIPILILKYLTSWSAQAALILGLIFPLGYGVWEYLKTGEKNPLSALGMANVILTGTFALLEIQGQWFALKEASLPFMLGLLVAGSSFTSQPLIQMFILTPQIFDLQRLTEQLKARDRELSFKNHLQRSTLLLSLSFFLSATLNLLLGLRIYTPLGEQLSALERKALLNDQIARMHGYSVIIVTLPCFIVFLVVLAYLNHGMKKDTGLSFEQLMHRPKNDEPEADSSDMNQM